MTLGIMLVVFHAIAISYLLPRCYRVALFTAGMELLKCVAEPFPAILDDSLKPLVQLVELHSKEPVLANLALQV